MVLSQSWLCFSCCITQQAPPMRPRIDRSMIGEPMNFQHTGHIGSGEVQLSVDLNDVTYRMRSKGGYQDKSVDDRLTPNGITISSSKEDQD